jgi:hypothetical protein
MQTQALSTAVEGDHVNAQLGLDLGYALAVWRTHQPYHISFDRLAVATHCSAPSSPW